jgi:hypothetical protein
MSEQDARSLDPENAKLVTLARSARARSGAAEGAAVRDTTGRTYSAATVALENLKLSAVLAALASAANSGADGLEAVVVVTEADALSDSDRAAVAELGGGGTPVLLAGPDGAVRATVLV